MNTPDQTTRMLTGELPFIILAATALAYPLSLFLLRLYRQRVLKSMRGRAAAPKGAPVPDATPRGTGPLKNFELHFIGSALTLSQGALLYQQSSRSAGRAKAIYAIAGIAFALVMGSVFLLSSRIEFLPLRFLMLVWVFSWPVIFTTNLIGAEIQRMKIGKVLVYFAILTLLTAAAILRSSETKFHEPFLLWAVINLPMTLLVLAFLNRRVRAVGPLILAFLIVALTGAVAGLDIVGGDEGTLRAVAEFAFNLGLGGIGTFVAIILVGFALFALLGWLAVTWIRRWYELKRISDQSITLDALWLLFGMGGAIGFAFEGPVWILSGIVAFAVYKTTVWIGFSLWEAKREGGLKNLRLLLLRVFALGKRSERLFDSVTQRWRYLGSVQLIAGPDLATTTVEPHEFLGFLSGKIARLFIGQEKDLDRKMAEMDLLPDFDGRFRVNDFFCYDDTWEAVLSRLVVESDVVLMDLRGFSQERKGCLREIDELINVVPLQRVVMVVDETTDGPFLEQTLHAAWEQRREESPNRSGDERALKVFRMTKENDLSHLVRWLCAAAAERARDRNARAA